MLWCRYEFSDKTVHEDIYLILRDACKEMMPADLAAKTLAFYTGLVEHFFGLKKRTPEEVHWACHCILNLPCA